MKITLRSIMTDALRMYKTLTREKTWAIGKEYGYIQSTVDRLFRSKEGKEMPCTKLNSRMKPAKDDDFIYEYKWNGGKTYFKNKQTRFKNGKRKLEKKQKNKRHVQDR